MLASAEVDVAAKQLCVQIAPNSHADSINEYRTIILSAYSSFPINTLSISRHGLALRPWSNWSEGENPIWWHAHNNVKHNRHTHFAEANLKNALNAVGALTQWRRGLAQTLAYLLVCRNTARSSVKRSSLGIRAYG